MDIEFNTTAGCVLAAREIVKRTGPAMQASDTGEPIRLAFALANGELVHTGQRCACSFVTFKVLFTDDSKTGFMCCTCRKEATL
jgi:hypothetical protein